MPGGVVSKWSRGLLRGSLYTERKDESPLSVILDLLSLPDASEFMLSIDLLCMKQSLRHRPAILSPLHSSTCPPILFTTQALTRDLETIAAINAENKRVTSFPMQER